MNRYLCVPVTINRVHMDIAKQRGRPFEVEAANEADAVVIAKQKSPLEDGESMAVMFLGRILVGNAGSGMPVGQGGGSTKIDASNVVKEG